MKIILIGATETALTLANLLGEDHQITIVERDGEIAKKIADQTQALVINSDGGDVSMLNEAGLPEADAIITTVDDKTNLMICEIAKKQNVEKIITLVSDPNNEELFTELGVVNIVSVVGTNVTAIKRMLYSSKNERIIAQLGQGKMQIVEITLSPESKLVGLKAHFDNAVLAALYREGDYIIPNGDTELQANDVLVIAVKTENLNEISKLVSTK